MAKTINNNATQECSWLVTFTSRLGDIPTMSSESTGAFGNVGIIEKQKGVAEIQTIKTSSSLQFQREVQVITPLADGHGGVTGTFEVYFMDSKTTDGATTCVIDVTDDAATVEACLEGLSTIGDVIVTYADRDVAPHTDTAKQTWTVTFVDPVGDIPLLETSSTGLNGGSANVDETHKGHSPLGGTFIVSYGQATTDNIDFDASEVPRTLR